MTTLIPENEASFLPVADVIKRATTVFAYVVTDQGRAMKRLVSELVARNPGVAHLDADDYLQPLAEAVEMICADDRQAEESFLVCYVVPGKPIDIVYYFSGHDVASEELLKRLANALNYSVAD